MKVTNLDPPGQVALDVARGRRSTLRATSSGITLRDSDTEANGVIDVLVLGGRITDAEDGTAILSIDTDTVLGLADIEERDHIHIVGETAVVNGTQTVVYLANEAELDTVAAYNASGARVAATQDPIYLDKLTFAAAPAAGTVLFDYVAATT